MRTPILAVVLLLIGAAAHAVDVVECGQTIRSGEIGELRQDLDCEAQPFPFPVVGVRLDEGALLNLNGFMLRGPGDGVGVVCASEGRRELACSVAGPGTITGFWAGFNGGGCRFVVRNITVAGNVHGIYGPLACDLDGEDLHVVDNHEDGIWVSRARGRRLTVSRNGGRGLVAQRVAIAALTAMHNGREGVRQSTTRGWFGWMLRSTVLENDAAGDGFDIAAVGRLRLREVQCRRSAKLEYPRVVDSSDDQPQVVGSYGCTDD